MKSDFKIRNQLENKSHNLLIHGYLMAVQNYVSCFGLESTAAYVLKVSGICKEDFIRCAKENGYEVEKTISIIHNAFNK